MKEFCREVCGKCPKCLAAMKEQQDVDDALSRLEQSDVDSLMRRDPDDPRTFALNHRGEP